MLDVTKISQIKIGLEEIHLCGPKFQKGENRLLFALRFDEKDQLVAAAPAAFVDAVGDRYWDQYYARPLPDGRDHQTAFAEVRDSDLIDQLTSLENDEEHLPECRRRIDLLIQPDSSMDARPRAA